MWNSYVKNLYANAIGQEVLRYLKTCDPSFLAEQAERSAVALLGEIQQILNDDTLGDPECFYRIDEIVSAFHRAGLSTSRHQTVE